MSRLLTIGVIQQAKNLLQSGGGSLYAIGVAETTAPDPCNSITTTTTVYCTESTLALAFANQAPIFSDASGNNYAPSAWYSDTPDQWYDFDSSKAQWGNDLSCGQQLLHYSIMGPFRSPCVESDTYFDIWFDDVGNFGIPITGAIIYTDQNGNNFLDQGLYAYEDLGTQDRTWLDVGASGEVTSHGKC